MLLLLLMLMLLLVYYRSPQGTDTTRATCQSTYGGGKVQQHSTILFC